MKKETVMENLLRIVTCLFLTLIMAFLSMVSILHTTKVADDESLSYLNDNFIVNLIWLGICFAVCFILVRIKINIPLWSEIVFIAIWTILFGFIWVFSSQAGSNHDSYYVTTAALQAAEGKFDFMQDGYYKNYSFQLGYVLLNEIFIRIASIFTNIETLVFLEAGNILFLAASYIAILLINNKIFNNPMINRITVFIMAFAIQPLIFSSFLYGIMPGLTFALYAIYFEIVWLKKCKLQFGILSCIFVVIAIMIKPNYIIFLIAMMMTAFAKLFKFKKATQSKININRYKCLGYIIVTTILGLSVNNIVKNVYEYRSGVELGDSVPYTCYISMGMNEAWNAPGWYNYDYTLVPFSNANGNADIASKQAVENIKERLKYFSEDSKYFQDFFFKKAASQWNETSYECLNLNKSMGCYNERGKLANWALNEGEQSLLDYMDLYSQFIYIAVFIGILAVLHRKNSDHIILPLIFLGGFLYHIISEAKSQYCMPYFICMIGFAPYGIYCAYELFLKKSKPFIKKFLEKKFLIFKSKRKIS